MGSDEIYYKRRIERTKRKENTLLQKSNRWLIVCEGTKTEPHYFQSIVDDFNTRIPKNYNLKVDIVGKGMNTISLVNSVDDFLNKIDSYKTRIIPYGKIFVVFDKDSFSSEIFDNAIQKCYQKGYIPLWSNQAIEFWFMLHFNYIDSKMNRTEYQNKISEYFKNKGLKYKYIKNDEKIYYKLIKYGSLELARKNAIKLNKIYINNKPSESESCTTVNKFFDEIDERLNELK